MAANKTTVSTGKWQAKNVEQVLIKPNKKLRFTDRIAAQVAAGKAKSRQDYIIRAVMNALEKDENSTES